MLASHLRGTVRAWGALFMKGEIFVKKIKIFCFTFLMTLVLGGTVSVFASENNTQISVEYYGQVYSLDVLCDYNVFYLTNYRDDCVFGYLVCADEGLFCSDNTLMAFNNYTPRYRQIKLCKNGDIVYSSQWFIENVPMPDSYEVLFSSHDICYADSADVFIQKKTAPIVAPITQVQKLPPMILKNLQPIVIVAVGLMASLIGCLILLPKLRTFL